MRGLVIEAADVAFTPDTGVALSLSGRIYGPRTAGS
jgi:hypothetical protein